MKKIYIPEGKSKLNMQALNNYKEFLEVYNPLERKNGDLLESTKEELIEIHEKDVLEENAVMNESVTDIDITTTVDDSVNEENEYIKFNSCNRLGRLAKKTGNLEEARQWYQKGLTIAENLVKEKDTVGNLRNLSTAYKRLGELEKERFALKETENWYEKSLLIDEKLVELVGSSESYQERAVSYYKLGEIAEMKGLPEKAKNGTKKN